MKRPILHEWAIGMMFGHPVIQGYDGDGVRRTKALLWWSDRRFGTDGGVFQQGQEETGSNHAFDR